MLNLKFLGHSCFYIEGREKRILIDPFLNDNPLAAVESRDVNPDLILLTHGHGDHIGDAIEIAGRTGAEVLGVFELMNYCQSHGVKNVRHAHIGGKIKYDFGWVKIVQAFHSSSTPDGTYAGMPVGFIINYHGHHIYHAGDTGVFGDMKLFAKLYRIDTALLPIGGNFTMDIPDAVEAVSMLKCRNVIPMHYDTFPPIEANPEEFKKKVEDINKVNCIILAPGESVELPLKAPAEVS